MTKKELALFDNGPKTINGLVRKFCGEQIGSGAFRDVYELKQLPKYVVKIERDMSTSAFANATEWRNYINNMYWIKFSEWLAPCHLINETGQFLIMTKVTFGEKTMYPKRIPSIFTDTKIKNYGWIGNKFVCCDYSFLNNGNFYLKTVRWRTK